MRLKTFSPWSSSFFGVSAMSEPENLVGAALDKHANVIGHVTISWNTAQSLVFVLFSSLSRLTYDEAQAIFFALKADTAQRDITRELGKVTLAADEALASEFSAAFNDLQVLSGQRNAAIHTMWSVLTQEGRITPSPTVPYHKSLDPDRTAEQFAELNIKIGAVIDSLIPLVLKIEKHLASQKKSRTQP
jgi:hypothetical protein